MKENNNSSNLECNNILEGDNFSFLTNQAFIDFMGKYKANNWDIFILFHKLQEFLFSTNFTKKEVFDIFDFFKFDKIDAIDFYVKKVFYSTNIKAGNLKKFKDSFTIFIIVFDFLYRKDIIDFHYKLNPNYSEIIEYYNFIEKVEIFQGWPNLQFIELLAITKSSDVYFHVKYNSRFFAKIAVFSDEVKELLIKLLSIRNIYDDPEIIEHLDFLMKELRHTANISLMHIFEILSSNIVFIIRLDKPLYWNDSQDATIIDYYENNEDEHIREFNVAAKHYYDNFFQSFDLYKQSYSLYMNKYPSNEIKSNNFKNKIKEIKDRLKGLMFEEKKLEDDKYLANKEYTLNINEPNKQKIYLIHYNFSDKSKLDFFNLIISKYNPVYLRRRNAFVKRVKLVNEGKVPLKRFPSKYEKELEEMDNDYFFFDLKQAADQETINELRELNKNLMDDAEKTLKSIKDQDYDTMCQFVIADSFDYLKFFFNLFKEHDLNSYQIMELLESKKAEKKDIIKKPKRVFNFKKPAFNSKKSGLSFKKYLSNKNKRKI